MKRFAASLFAGCPQAIFFRWSQTHGPKGPWAQFQKNSSQKTKKKSEPTASKAHGPVGHPYGIRPCDGWPCYLDGSGPPHIFRLLLDCPKIWTMVLSRCLGAHCQNLHGDAIFQKSDPPAAPLAPKKPYLEVKNQQTLPNLRRTCQKRLRKK